MITPILMFVYGVPVFCGRLNPQGNHDVSVKSMKYRGDRRWFKWEQTLHWRKVGA